jgi:transcription antitermination factor NusG
VAGTLIQTTPGQSDVLLPPVVPAEHTEERWYAVATNPRHEKWVALQMRGYDIDHFLPLYKSVRRWKDRRKQLELPLFPGYLFVHIALRNRLQVLQIPGVIQLVGASGKPSALPEHEIGAVRQSLLQAQGIEPHPYLREGVRVRVSSGAMQGVEGILIRRKDEFRVVLSVPLIRSSFALEVDEADISLA